MGGRCTNVGGIIAGGLAAIVVGSAVATLFSVITAASTPYPGKSCNRKCEVRDTRICSFSFNIHLYQSLSRACGDCPGNSSHCWSQDCISGNGIKRLVTVADKQLPGPPIQVCEGDEIQVTVHNKLPSAGVSLHWHGLTPSPYMDGAPGLTQTLIPPNQDFLYTLQAAVPGTHFWHALSGFQSGDGLFGPLVVRQPKPSDPHSHLYDHDLSQHVIMVHDWLHVPTAEKFTLHHHSGADHFPDDILVNGRGRYTGDQSSPDSREAPMAEFTVREGERYRFRLISAAFMNCPITFNIARHTLTVIAADGAAIVPYNTTDILMQPGERWDVVVKADKEPANYWMNFVGELDCSLNSASEKAILRYTTHSVRPKLDRERNEEPFDNLRSVMRREPVTVANLRSVATIPTELAKPSADATLYFTFSLRHIDNPKYYDQQFYSIHDEGKAYGIPSPQINNLTYRALPATLLLSQTPPSAEQLCNADRSPVHCQHDALCECLHLHHLSLGEIVDIVLIDAGGDSNQGQTVHLHGHSFYVLDQGVLPPGPDAKELQRQHVMDMDQQGKLNRNLENPVRKDTVMVPKGGYTIIRFKADNPGYWLLHSQLLFHWVGGMAVVLQVGDQSDIPSPPSSIPLCPM